MLNSILNPNLPLGEAVYDPEEQVEEVEVEEDSKEILDAEKEAVQAAEKGDLTSALTLFDKVTLRQNPNDIYLTFTGSWLSSTQNVPPLTTTGLRRFGWSVARTRL